MTDYSDKNWLREEEPFLVRVMNIVLRLVLVGLILAVLGLVAMIFE